MHCSVSKGVSTSGLLKEAASSNHTLCIAALPACILVGPLPPCAMYCSSPVLCYAVVFCNAVLFCIAVPSCSLQGCVPWYQGPVQGARRPTLINLCGLVSTGQRTLWASAQTFVHRAVGCGCGPRHDVSASRCSTAMRVRTRTNQILLCALQFLTLCTDSSCCLQRTAPSQQLCHFSCHAAQAHSQELQFTCYPLCLSLLQHHG